MPLLTEEQKHKLCKGTITESELHQLFVEKKLKPGKVVWERKYSAGYTLRRELIDGSQFGGKDFEMTKAYSPEGHYIGNSKDAYNIVVKRGIAPEPIDKTHNICSVGFCKKDQKWYGWSHRAIFGFGIGDKIFSERDGDRNTHFAKHGKKTIKSLKDARLAAARFAGSVS